MQDRMAWSWEAERDFHGTTMNRLVQSKPDSWKQAASSEPRVAQWTRCTTIPKSVAEAEESLLLKQRKGGRKGLQLMY
jgi:hypothetical protein